MRSFLVYAVETPRSVLKFAHLCHHQRDRHSQELLAVAPVNSIAVLVVLCSIDKIYTDVGHLTREFSRFLRHFLTCKGEIDCEETGR